MVTRISLVLSLLLMVCVSVASAETDVKVDVSLDQDGLKSFHLAIGERYQSPQKEIVVVRKQVTDEELPVAFIIAEAAGVGVPAVVKLRIGGMSWMEISLHFDLSPSVFYVPLARDPGPPYGKAYGHFKNKANKKSKKIQLTDTEIIDWANLRFLSEYHHCSPDEIVKSRKAGHGFVAISKGLKTKAIKQREKSQSAEKDKTKQKGKGKKR